MDRWVRDFHGAKIRVQCDENELQTVLYERFIVPYLYELEYAWLAGNKAEEKVKGYLDYICSLMIRQPDKHNVIDPRKMRKIHTIELTGDGASELAREMRPVRSKAKKKPRRETRTMRIDKIHRQMPGCEVCICSVDTEGWFEYKGKAFLISSELTCYAPKVVKGEELYDMDRVMVVEFENGLRFYDQNVFPIDSDFIIDSE